MISQSNKPDKPHCSLVTDRDQEMNIEWNVVSVSYYILCTIICIYIRHCQLIMPRLLQVPKIDKKANYQHALWLCNITIFRPTWSIKEWTKSRQKSVYLPHFHVKLHFKSWRACCYLHFSFDRWFSYAIVAMSTLLVFTRTVISDGDGHEM